MYFFNCTLVIVNSTQLVFTCREGFHYNEIPFSLFNVSNLNQITSFYARGANGARGPFISIPSNICLLSNLQVLNLSFNRINSSAFNILTSCSLFTTLQTLDLSANYLTIFPMNFTSQISSLKNIYVQYNQLEDIPISAFYNVEYLDTLDFSHNNLLSFELWTFLVSNSVDYSFNQIFKITNNANFRMSQKKSAGTHINLSNNEQIYLNDGIYEMYDTCSEVQYWLQLTDNSFLPPSFTLGLYTIDFGTSLVDCTCDSYYIQKLLPLISGSSRSISNYSLANTTCSDGITKFVDFNLTNCSTSTMNFTSLIPRFCKINSSENGIVPVYSSGQNYTEQTTTNILTTSTSPTNSLRSSFKDNTLEVVLSSVLGTAAALLLIGAVLLAIHRKRKMSKKDLRPPLNRVEERPENFSWLHERPADTSLSCWL